MRYRARGFSAPPSFRYLDDQRGPGALDEDPDESGRAGTGAPRSPHQGIERWIYPIHRDRPRAAYRRGKILGLCEIQRPLHRYDQQRDGNGGEEVGRAPIPCDLLRKQSQRRALARHLCTRLHLAHERARIFCARYRASERVSSGTIREPASQATIPKKKLRQGVRRNTKRIQGLAHRSQSKEINKSSSRRSENKSEMVAS